MSKILEATCEAGVVTSMGVPVPAAEIQSQGLGESSGLLILEQEKAFYVPKASPDLDTTLAKIISALEQIITAHNQSVTALNSAVTAFTAATAGLGLVDGKPTGGAGSAVTPLATASIATVTAQSALITTAASAITTASTAIGVIKTEIQTLKGMLK